MIPREEELIYRSRWIVRIRWVVALTMGLGVLGFHLLDLPYALGPLLHLSVAVAGYNFLFVVAAKWALKTPVFLRRVYRFVNLQIAADFLVLLSWIHFSGGPTSPFLPFFIFHLVICGLLVSFRSTLIHACWVLIALVVMGIGETYGWLPHYSPLNSKVVRPIDSTQHLMVVGAVTGSMLIAVAVLVGGIARRLRRGEQELVHARQTCELHSNEVEEAHEQLEKIANERNSFFLLSSHQLRSPLTSIQSVLRLIISGNVEDKDTITELVSRADRQSEHMLSLINDLLSLTRIRSLKEIEERETIPLTDVLWSVVEGQQNSAHEKNIQLTSKIDPKLPIIHGIKNRIEQLFSVLLDNAVKYTPEDGEVSLTAKQKDCYVHIVVKDSGIGIDPKAQDKIFSEFYRAPNARKYTRTGTGLGLSLAENIVNGLKGSLKLESESGKGSTFTVIIPVEEPVDPAPTGL